MRMDTMPRLDTRVKITAGRHAGVCGEVVHIDSSSGIAAVQLDSNGSCFGVHFQNLIDLDELARQRAAEHGFRLVWSERDQEWQCWFNEWTYVRGKDSDELVSVAITHPLRGGLRPVIHDGQGNEL